ncbi:MAG: ABC transporter substrate-binding protein [Spirochaetales bacterium]|uniref:ABC transporter substrate-binding protein n=1 Tax=Candidatus Thalassospirochaeta sargassi TaxID=3119039 RepID=A0AAJ1ID71_9SPIO|nr:ABC transporter substrate-binding protein [Spirochaetales bacterium]
MLKKTVLSVLFITLLVIPAALFAGGQSEGNVIKIGFDIPLTGDRPKVGEGTKFAAELIKEKVNAAGGLEVGGEKYMLDFIYVDNELKAESAVQAAFKLIEQDQVLAIVGPDGSTQAIPAGQVANDNRTPLISPWSTNPNTTLDRPYVFRACFLDPFQAPVAAKFASEQFGAETVSVMYNLEDDYSKTLAELFKAAWEEKNGAGSVLNFESYGNKDQDFSVQLTAITAADPDFLYLPCFYNKVAMIVPQAKDLGWEKPVMGSDSWGSADLVKLSKGAVKGYYFTTHYAAAGAVGATKDFIDEYNEAYGYVPDDVGALSFDAVNIVLQAIQNAGLTGDLQTDRDAVKDAMASLESYPGITGTMTFTPDGDPIKDAVVVMVNDDGEFEFVATMQP